MSNTIAKPVIEVTNSYGDYFVTLNGYTLTKFGLLDYENPSANANDYAQGIAKALGMNLT